MVEEKVTMVIGFTPHASFHIDSECYVKYISSCECNKVVSAF